ncbi:flagellar hook-associated protein FlgK [Psychromonas sp. SP041]|uniref:flagellar hook-associated protein FlgK n=1 Tax=Psychromonas sp. SP041 TaxID=1365007 RepID=UPI00041BBF2C|nr:flagellar hook-associated protein FlgK [Psychromonas sp. SP041]
MADLLQIGLSGIYSSQASLTTTSHNISNVSTEGYSRQTVDTSAAGAQRLSTNFIGSGSVVSSIDRAYDQFAFTENVINTSSYAYYEQTYTQANQMDLLLSSDNTSATTSVLNMFSSLSSIADNPSLLEARNVFLQDASSMVSQYNTLYSHLETQYESINAEIDNSSDVITELAQSIASLNSQISIVTGSASGGVANDLLDKRNLAITELSEYVNTSVVEADNNMVNIYIGSGQGLVMGTVSQSVIAVDGDPDPTRKELALNFNGQATTINGNKLGGGVAALFNSRDNDLEVAMNQLGQSVIGLTHAINEQQKEGQTLNGEVGADIFNDINSTESMQNRVLSHDDGLGKAVLSVRIDDLSELSADEFTLKVSEYTAGSTLSFIVTNNTTGTSQEVSVADLSTEARVSIPGAGISVGIDSIIQPLEEGKEFTLRPTRHGAMEATVLENDAEKIAAADAEIKASLNSDNTGTAEFRVSAISNRSDSHYMDEDNPLTIRISANTTDSEIAYNLFDKDGIQVNTAELTTPVDPLTGKATFIAGGVEVEMKSGSPAANDEIILSFNETGDGDNRNMLAITDLQSAKIMNGNKSSFQDVYNNMLSEIGAKTANADVAMQSASILKDQSFERIQSLSGVNMDEEAANLLMYQQYYSAAARVITVANEIFDSLLQASR